MSEQNDSPRHVPLWTSVMEEEYRARGKSSDVHLFLDRDGRMCRQCFATFERASKIWEVIKGGVAKAANILIPNVAHPMTTSLPTPKRPRYSASNSMEQSPKVKVSIYN